ncbi:hypothetical protein GCM10027447_02030 [Glycomyces halotolerans]
MTTTDIDNSEPALEWCPACDRPAPLCECDRTPNSIPATSAAPQRTGPVPNTDEAPNGNGTEHRTPPGLRNSNEANTARMAIAEHPDSDPGKSPGFWAAKWQWVVEWGPLLPIWLLAAGLGAAGFASSFVTVEAKMGPYFGELAWLVPTATDLGIIVFTLLDIFLARRNQRIPWMRHIPWALTAATIYLNVTSYTAFEAQVAHAVLPSLWVVFSEAIARIMREKAEDETPTTKKVPIIRWVCAPIATLILWRAMKLWKIPTYDEALRLEEERQLSKAVMRDCFGSVRAAPRTLRVRYRQRKITVKEVYQTAHDSRTTVPAASEPTVRKHTSGRRSAAPVEQRSTRPARGAADKTERATPVRSRSAKTGARASASRTAASDRLSSALAELRSEGVANPSVRALAERAGCSPSTAHAFMNKLEHPGAA